MKIGIDIGGNHVAVGLIDIYGKIICQLSEDTVNSSNNSNYGKDLVNIIIKQIQEIFNKSYTDITNISLIGIAVPGMVSSTSIIKAKNLHINNFNIVEEINKYYNVPIKLRNDAKCAALAEKEYGSLKKINDALYLSLGTGIGGAVFLGGELLVPKKYEGFEVGHMCIETNGIQCNCGRKGCFEKYASMSALKENISKVINKKSISGEELKEVLEKRNNNEIEIVVNQYLKYLCIGLANLINIFEPEVICLGGSFTYYEETLFEKLKESITKEAIFNNENIPKFSLAKLKNNAGIIGSVL